MLPSDPNWLSADAALWAAIFAGLSLVATVGGIIVAVFALRWARKAAQEAGKQAQAAIASVDWSRRAAEEAGKQANAAFASVEIAREQAALLEKQIAFSEPQPVVTLSIRFTTGGGVSPVIEVESVGEQLAFDVQVGDLSILREVPERKLISTVRFERIPVLKLDGKPRAVRGAVDPILPSTRIIFGEADEAMTAFMEYLVSQTLANVESVGQPTRGQRLMLGYVGLHYRNARRRPYTQHFFLYALPEFAATGARSLEFVPEGSLVDSTVTSP